MGFYVADPKVLIDPNRTASMYRLGLEVLEVGKCIATAVNHNNRF